MDFGCEVCSKKATHTCSDCRQIFFCGKACWGASNHQFQCVGAEYVVEKNLLNSWVKDITLTEGVATTTDLRRWISDERAFPPIPKAILVKGIGFSVALWFKCIEDIFYHDYSDAFFLFWTGQDKRAILSTVQRLIQGSRDFWISFGETFPYSFPLQELTPPEHHNAVLYQYSKRPQTSMQKYLERSGPTYMSEEEKDPTYEYLPVTRYSPMRGGGLYNRGKTASRGTFYYFEPESRVYLQVKKDRVQSYPSKDDAYEALVGRERLKNSIVPDASDPLMYSAKEVMRMLLKTVHPEKYDAKDYERDMQNFERMPENEKDVKCYCAFKFQMYAASDILDYPLLEAARQHDLDVLIFEREVGSRQRVKEVFDLRDREISFSNLWRI